jgi:hypothetical protein
MVHLVKTCHGSAVPAKQYQPCGGVALFDGDYSYRCMDCFAVIGSMGQPQSCKDEAAKYDNWKELGGKGWDYDNGVAL